MADNRALMESVQELQTSMHALLEDLQTSVSRPPSSAAVNGLASPGGTRTYREVTTRTVQHDGTPGYQVQYLSAANPTTVVSERASSPGVITMQQQQSGNCVATCKTMSYQYNTTNSTSQPISGLIVDGSSVTSDPTSDVRLQQNLNELDNLLVDLHQAQKAGFGTEQGSVTTGVATTRDINPIFLQPVDQSTPSHSQVQQVTRVVEQRRYIDGGGTSPSPIRYQNEPPSSPRLQPKRSSSAQRELMYGTIDSQRHTTRSPSPMRHPEPSPRVPQRTVVQKETYYETKSNTVPKPERYRDKSPSNRRLQKEMLQESSKSSTSIPPSPQFDRYYDASPPSQRRGTSPLRPVNDSYSVQPGSATRITTVRTYNYNTSGSSGPSPVPPGSHSGVPSASHSPYPDHNTHVIELTPSPSPVIPVGSPPQLPTPSGTKVTTTVRTYSYELPGQTGSKQYPPGTNQPYPPGTNQPYPPGSVQPYPPSTVQPYPPSTVQPYPPTTVQPYPPGANQPYPPNYSPTEPSGECTLTYQVSPRDKEPLIETPPPTVITYKYSSHSSHSTSSKFPVQPEEQEPLLPRPFPTSSPTPPPGANSQPPKRLDDLMASFSDTEASPRHYEPQKHTLHPQQPYPGDNTGVAVVAPTPNAKAAAAAGASASASAAATASTAAKDRPKTKNIAGPPVYYPPGVELFAKKEESMMMQGKKGSGRYEYEYAKESKSKSSSSGGAAVVPVCLPLCCAMPCVIM
ncbi:uncharacterized protein [Periplaneta americana]|uniref:uncharacterized protein isoform X2 n=1 Tax=Periplaneta americana TaxID=6978 RepID=UPI0037E7EE99